VTEVVFTAVDDAGNQSQCTTTVEVIWTPWSFAIFAWDDKGIDMHKETLVHGEVFSAERLKMHKDSLIEGAAFAYGKVDLDDDTDITAGFYADGDVKNKGNAIDMGAVPDGIPPAPALDPTWYQDLLDIAQTQPNGDVKVTTLDLQGGTLFVKGKFTLKKNGTLTGPGTIVATKDIKIEKDGTVGDGVTLVAGKHLHVDKDCSVGVDGLFFGYDGIHIHEDTTLADVDLVADGHIHLHKDVFMTGLVFSTDKVDIGGCHHGINGVCPVNVTGAVLAGGAVKLEKDASVVHDCGVSLELPPGVVIGPPIDPPATSCECHGKVTDLALQYDGAAGADIDVVQKNGDVVFSGWVVPGAVFSFSGTDNGTLGTEISVYVDGGLQVKIHTSCSKPIGVGLVACDFSVVGGASKDGGPLCAVDADVNDCECDPADAGDGGKDKKKK
jgi:hypothetical protein